MLELRGKPVACKIEEDIVKDLSVLQESNVAPVLAVVRVGEDQSQKAYEKGLVSKSERLGIKVEKYICSENIEEDDLIEVIRSINENENIHGILLLQPLPERMDGRKVRNAIAVKKDVDCTSDGSLGRFFTDRDFPFSPCTAESVIEILDYYHVDITGKKAVVIGRSMVIGKPVALMLTDRNATVTVCHSRTDREDLKKLCREADIIVTASGRQKTLTGDMAGEKTFVVDVGINFSEEGKMCGDADYEALKDKVAGITPVPGGVGSVTTSVMFRHLMRGALAQNGLK